MSSQGVKLTKGIIGEEVESEAEEKTRRGQLSARAIFFSFSSQNRKKDILVTCLGKIKIRRR